MPSIDTLFRESWQRFTPLWKRLVGIALAFYALTLLLESLMLVLGVGGMGILGLSAVFSNASAFPWTGALGVAAIGGIVLIFLELLASAWLQATVITAVHDNNPAQSFSDVARKGRAATNRVFGAMLLSVFFILLGLLVFLLPGIYLAIAFSFVAYVATLEGLGAGAALRRSRELVRGRWWPVFGALFVLGLVLGLLAFLVEALGRQVGGTILETLLSILVGILITPFGAVYTYLLYKHLSGK